MRAKWGRRNRKVRKRYEEGYRELFCLSGAHTLLSFEFWVIVPNTFAG
jgi:hypothetical protein